MTNRATLLLALAAPALAQPHQAPPSQPCQVIHGRAHLFTGDGQLRIWHIGTHHEFQPDASSWNRVQRWLEQGATEAQKKQSPDVYAGTVYLYGDFSVCPLQPFRSGAVQTARIQGVRHRHYTPAP